MRQIHCSTGELVHTYPDYLQTKHWREFRELALYRAKDKCSVPGCRTRDSLHVHHLTYKRIGEELLKDVLVLCADCHKLRHQQILKKYGWNREERIGQDQALRDQENRWLETQKVKALRILKNTNHPNNVLHNIHQAYSEYDVQIITDSKWFNELLNRKRKSRGLDICYRI